MKHPTIKQLDFVIDKLKSILPQASKENAFRMGEGEVYSDGKHDYRAYQCGTVHCAGGWYAVANLRRKLIKNKYNKGFVDYQDGADLMADDLGFECRTELENWARDNREIWGNKQGRYLFVSSSAYNNPGFAGVVKQFEIVRSNLMKLKG